MLHAFAIVFIDKEEDEEIKKKKLNNPHTNTSTHIRTHNRKIQKRATTLQHKKSMGAESSTSRRNIKSSYIQGTSETPVTPETPERTTTNMESKNIDGDFVIREVAIGTLPVDSLCVHNHYGMQPNESFLYRVTGTVAPQESKEAQGATEAKVTVVNISNNKESIVSATLPVCIAPAGPVPTVNIQELQQYMRITWRQHSPKDRTDTHFSRRHSGSRQFIVAGQLVESACFPIGELTLTDGSKVSAVSGIVFDFVPLDYASRCRAIRKLRDMKVPLGRMSMSLLVRADSENLEKEADEHVLVFGYTPDTVRDHYTPSKEALNSQHALAGVVAALGSMLAGSTNMTTVTLAEGSLKCVLKDPVMMDCVLDHGAEAHSRDQHCRYCGLHLRVLHGEYRGVETGVRLAALEGLATKQFVDECEDLVERSTEWPPTMQAQQALSKLSANVREAVLQHDGLCRERVRDLCRRALANMRATKQSSERRTELRAVLTYSMCGLLSDLSLQMLCRSLRHSRKLTVLMSGCFHACAMETAMLDPKVGFVRVYRSPVDCSALIGNVIDGSPVPKDIRTNFNEVLNAILL